MKRVQNSELEKKLILEEYDPETTGDRAEDENLLLDDGCEQASAIVKAAYKKLENGHAIVRQQLSLFVCFGVFLFGVGVPAFFFIMFFVEQWWKEGGMIFAVIVFPCASIGAAIALYHFFLKGAKKLFDIYYFRQDGKRIIIYRNKKYTVYYRSRKELVCIENKTGKWIENYGREDFMNLKLGFNMLVGDLKYQKFKRGGYGVWTPARYETASGLHTHSGYASLRVDGDYNPVSIFIDGGRYTSYTIDFKNTENFKIVIPRQMLVACEQLNIDPPKGNEWITFEE